MSDNILYFVPRDPAARSTKTNIENALEFLREIYPSAECTIYRDEMDVTFLDAGENTRSVSCPYCGSDLDGWWQDAMDAVAASRFRHLLITTPCRGKPTSLNDLTYAEPAAFGSGALTIVNPGAPSVSTMDLRNLERVAGTHLEMIWQNL